MTIRATTPAADQLADDAEQHSLGQAAYWLGRPFDARQTGMWRAGWLAGAGEARNTLTDPVFEGGPVPRAILPRLASLADDFATLLPVLGLFHGKKITPGERSRVVMAESAVRRWLENLGHHASAPRPGARSDDHSRRRTYRQH